MKATATEVKNRFGEFLERAVREPVEVEKSGRPVAVLLSREEYERLQAMDDHYWGERAMEAAKTGHLGHEEAMRRLSQRLAEIESEEQSEARSLPGGD